MKTKWNHLVCGWLTCTAILTGGMAKVSAQNGFEAKLASSSAPQTPVPMKQLVWLNERQEASPKPTDLTADFAFTFTNISDSEAIIDHVRTSCSCTAAKLPTQPWHIGPHTNGQVNVTVDLKNKMGQFEKTITVFFDTNQNFEPKALTVTVKMPDMKEFREANMQIAKADRQAVFKGDCANCHAEPAKHESGMALFHDVCGICHEAHPRASMTPDLRLINNHPTDYAFWKTMIANGKPGTLMPAFAQSQGGPLTDQQIDSMAKMIDKAYPWARFAEEYAAKQTNKVQQTVEAKPDASKN